MCLIIIPENVHQTDINVSFYLGGDLNSRAEPGETVDTMSFDRAE